MDAVILKEINAQINDIEDMFHGERSDSLRIHFANMLFRLYNLRRMIEKETT